MSATVVIPFSPRHFGPHESWLTEETLTAYYVALSVRPELAQAPAVVRAEAVERVIAGMRAASTINDLTDAKGRAQCIALMRQDAEAATVRRVNGGW